MVIERARVTGLVLAGGRGSRMGGVDKGLQPFRGRPLVAQAIERLRPQVGALIVNANRHLHAYEALGVPTVPDAQADFAGPLAGMLAGMRHCQTPYLVTVPCDTPGFPPDLVQRLAAALEPPQHCIAMAATRDGSGRVQVQPVFCLLPVSLGDDLAAALAGGERKIDRWTALHGCAQVVFDDEQAFFNVNTLQDLDALDRSWPAPPERG
jgi:molybdopterin-guanine dinucleotide biosynthesis protein A